jgi:hypothetical protein
MQRRQADRGIVDLGAAGVALIAFLLLPFAFVGDLRTGLGWLLDGRWAFALPVVASLAAAFIDLIQLAGELSHELHHLVFVFIEGYILCLTHFNGVGARK